MSEFPYKTTGELTYTSKVGDTPTTPDDITVRIFKPDGSEVGSASEPTPTGTGTQTHEVAASDADVIGKWTAQWDWTSGTSNHRDIEDFWVTGVIEPVSSVSLCTLEQVKEKVGIPVETTDDDARITRLIRSATEVIQRQYKREFVPQVSETRQFRVDRRDIDLSPFDLRSITTATLHPKATTPTVLTVDTDYTLTPHDGALKTATYLGIRLGADVTLDSDFSDDFGYSLLDIAGAWGVWATESAIAEDINLAAIETVLSWLDKPTQEVAGLDSLGEVRQLQPSTSTHDIPFSAHLKLEKYERKTWWT